MYLKRRNRPFVQDLPDTHEGYQIQIWDGKLCVSDPKFTRTFDDSEILRAYSDAIREYPRCEVLLFESVRVSRRKLKPVPPEQLSEMVNYRRKS